LFIEVGGIDAIEELALEHHQLRACDNHDIGRVFLRLVLFTRLDVRRFARGLG